MAAIMMKMLMKLVTEKFVTDMILLGLKKLSAYTDNDLDDKMVQSVEKALLK